jgi:hypothetical protein
MIGVPPHSRKAMDRWLADQRTALINDLGALLDVEAGLCEVQIPARHAALIDDLRNTLNVDSGLAAMPGS